MSVIISGQKKTSFPMSLALMLCKSAPDHEVHNYFSLAPHPHFNATFQSDRTVVIFYSGH